MAHSSINYLRLKNGIMEFNEKLQELRKQKGLTQEQLAEELYVSRTAVSKWESGRGYPSIDSLKAISKFFSVTVDELLSGEELLNIAEEDHKQKEDRIRDLIFGLLDICVSLLIFLPLFAKRSNGIIEEVSLLSLNSVSMVFRLVYFVIVGGIILSGIFTIALQNCKRGAWVFIKHKLSFFLNSVGALLFIISLQPYAAIFLFVFLILKALVLIKWR